MGFDNVAATTQQLGEGPVTRLIKEAGVAGVVGYQLLVKLAAHLGVELASGQEMSAAAKEIQRSLLAGLANGALGAKETLKDAAGILLQQGHITPEGAAAFGFVYGLVEFVKESGEDLAQPELMVEAIGGILDLSFAAIQGDQRAIDELKHIGYSAAQAPVSMSAETAHLWEEGEYFKAGSGSAKVVWVGLAAKELKDQLQKAFLKLKHHRRTKGSQGALNNIVGEAGEAAAMIRISRKGNKKIVAMRNDRNQGIDYVYRDKKGQIVFVEVKAHEGGRIPRLSKNQKKSREFCEGRLNKLTGKDNDPLYKNVPEELKQFARELLDEIDPKKGNKPFRAIVINVDNALSPNPIISYSEWLNGLGPTIPNP